ncbi:MAG: hypothetical protein ACK5VJ_00890 [Pseudomonadota bacterium]|jgi:hypothetical protein
MLHTLTSTHASPSALAEMLTLEISLSHLHAPEAEGTKLALALAKPEWLGLMSHFTRMPADERARVGMSIREALAHVPPMVEDAGEASRSAHHAWDSFMGDCVLLAALAETTTARVLEGTVLAGYRVVRGNTVKSQMH